MLLNQGAPGREALCTACYVLHGWLSRGDMETWLKAAAAITSKPSGVRWPDSSGESLQPPGRWMPAQGSLL